MTPLELDALCQLNKTRALGCDGKLRKRSRSMLSRLPFHEPRERQLLFADWTGGRGLQSFGQRILSPHPLDLPSLSANQRVCPAEHRRCGMTMPQREQAGSSALVQHLAAIGREAGLRELVTEVL